MDVEVGSVRLTELRDFCLRTFRHVAEGRGLDLSIDLTGKPARGNDHYGREAFTASSQKPAVGTR